MSGPSTTSARPAALAAILLGVFVVPMSITGTTVALPRIAESLGSDSGLLQAVVNGFNTTFAISMLLWGVSSDRLGHRATLRLGVVLVLLSALGSAVAPTLLALDGARILAGIGAAAIFTGASATLGTLWSGAERTRAFSIFATVLGFGIAFGPTISGGLVTVFGWRGMFVVHAGVLTMSLLGTLTLLPRTPRHALAARRPDFRPLANPAYLAWCLVPVSGSIGFVAILAYLPTAFSSIAGLPTGLAGLALLPLSVPVLLAPIVASRLLIGARMSPMAIVYAAIGLLVVGDLGLLFLSPGAPYSLLIVPMIMIGFGFGGTLGLVDGNALALIPAQAAGLAAGSLNFIRMGSEALFVALYAAALARLLSARLASKTAAEVAAGAPGHATVYAWSFHIVVLGLVAAHLVVACAIALLHRSRHRSAASHPDADAPAALRAS